MASLSAAPKLEAPRDVQLPPIERFTTPEGLSVVAVRRGELPMVALRLVVRAGSATDPKGKLGLSDFTARLTRRGTKKLSADQLDEAIEFVGATLALGATEETWTCAATTPTEHLDRILDVMGQLLREPSFPKAEVESAKKRLIAQIGTELDDPSAVADRAFLRAIWGDHPYGHEPVGRKKDLVRFEREDLVRFHKERIGPRVSTLYVVGAFDLEQLRPAVARAFAGWKGGPATAPEAPEVSGLPNAGTVFVVDKPEQTQSQVRIGAAGLRRGHPDSFAVTIFNTSLGGGFTSRLVNEVRVNRGLSYGVSSHFMGLKAGGYFEVSTFTKNASTQEIIDVALEQIEKMKAKGPTPAELQTARTYVAGLYPLRIETNEALANAIADVDLHGLGLSWIETYRSRMWAVTPPEALAAARRYLLPERPVIVVVGRASEVIPQLQKYGPLKQLKIADLE